MKKNFYILLLLFFNSNIFAQSETDSSVPLDTNVCNDFLQLITQQSDSYELNTPPYYDYLNLRILPDFELGDFANGSPFKRSEKQNLYADIIFEYLDDFYMSDEIIEINGKKVAWLNDEEIIEAFDLDDSNITFNVFNENLPEGIDETRSFTIPKYSSQTPLSFDIEIESIEFIDSSKSTYKTRYVTRVMYELTGFDNIIEKLFINTIADGFDIESGSGISCFFSEDEILKTGIYTPEIRPTNVVSLEGDSTKVKYELNAIYENGESQYSFSQIGDYISTFRSSFNFRTFPFDKQYLEFSFEDARQYSYIYFSADTDSYLNTISNLEIYEWDILGLDWVIENEPTYYGWGLKVVHGIEIERNSLYFLTKIFLPILIILGLSFSVMWIKPNQLQSRLTVSVVCFLALITYTFIIDKDLPKLDYLTVMDYIILVSYLFAAIPTIESVSISKQENNEKAEYIDRNYRILLPIIYISITFVMVLTVIAFNLDNTKAFLN